MPGWLAGWLLDTAVANYCCTSMCPRQFLSEGSSGQWLGGGRQAGRQMITIHFTVAHAGRLAELTGSTPYRGWLCAHVCV